MNIIDKQIDEQMEYIAAQARWWANNSHHYESAIEDLVLIGAEVRLSFTGIDVTMTGGKNELRLLFKFLRKNGFAPTHRPTEKDKSYWGAFFYKNLPDEDLKPLWVSFSSNVCKRVQVGTEMKEVPVYEVQCSDNLEVEDEA